MQNQKLSLLFLECKNQKIRIKMNFFSGYTNFFCSRIDATGKDLLALDLDGIVNELSED